MTDTRAGNELGDFLRAARGRTRPEQVGLPAARRGRRAPGLRREELALLAGVGVSYYTRIEQGQSRNVGPEVLTAIADILRLSEAERAHLLTLTGRDLRRRRGGEIASAPDAGLVQLLDAAPNVPSLIMGRYSEVLAWNRAGRMLLAPHLGHVTLAAGDRPNLAEMVFLDPYTRDLYANWPQKAQAVVGNLRIVCAQHPNDARLARLIGDLTIRSTEFSALWNDHRIQPCASMTVTLRHPDLGTMTVLQQSLRSASTPDQLLVTHTAAAGSTDADALAIASHLAGDDAGRYAATS